MTNDMRTTYRREDGELIDSAYSYVADIEYFTEDSEPADVVEEQWQLVRYRVIRLGPDDQCEHCGGEGLIPVCDFEGEYVGESPCPCQGSGIKPRDTNPEWVEVGLSTSDQVQEQLDIVIESWAEPVKESVNEILRNALKRARDDMRDWQGYASDYFIKKWDGQADLDNITHALEAADEGSTIGELALRQGVKPLQDLSVLTKPEFADFDIPTEPNWKEIATALEGALRESIAAYGGVMDITADTISWSMALDEYARALEKETQ